jgi:hypothetical protein
MVFVLAGLMRNSFISGNVQMQFFLWQKEPLLVNMDGVVEVFLMEVNRVKFWDRVQRDENHTLDKNTASCWYTNLTSNTVLDYYVRDQPKFTLIVRTLIHTRQYSIRLYSTDWCRGQAAEHFAPHQDPEFCIAVSSFWWCLHNRMFTPLTTKPKHQRQRGMTTTVCLMPQQSLHMSCPFAHVAICCQSFYQDRWKW